MSRALTLADYAAVERDGREQFYPDMVRRGEISPDEAQHDWLCWKAMAEHLANPDVTPEFFRWDLGWDQLEAACQRALRRRDEALAAAKPELRGPLEARRAAVFDMLRYFERTARFYREVTAELQARARADIARRKAA